MKKRILLSIALVTSVQQIFGAETNNKPAAEPIKLSSDVARHLDNSYAINGAILELILYVRQKINSMLGTAHKDKTIQCHIMYNGKEQSIKALAVIEKNQGWTPELQTCLTFAKNLLEQTLVPFVDQARNQKKIMTTLIEEYCQRTGCPNSLMLEWASATDDNEAAIFHEKVTSFAHLEVFCTDISGFLTALINCCPKAQHEYKLKCKKKILNGIIDETVESMKKSHAIDSKKHEAIAADLAHRLETDHTLISAVPKPEEKAYIKVLITELLNKK